MRDDWNCSLMPLRAILGGQNTISGSYQNVSDRRRPGSFHGLQFAGNEARIDRQIAAVGRSVSRRVPTDMLRDLAAQRTPRPNVRMCDKIK